MTRSVSDAIRICARLNAIGARDGARLVAFNAALIARRERNGLVPASVCTPANDHHKPPLPAA